MKERMLHKHLKIFSVIPQDYLMSPHESIRHRPTTESSLYRSGPFSPFRTTDTFLFPNIKDIQKRTNVEADITQKPQGKSPSPLYNPRRIYKRNAKLSKHRQKFMIIEGKPTGLKIYPTHFSKSLPPTPKLVTILPKVKKDASFLEKIIK